jgi:hypothetical protein
MLSPAVMSWNTLVLLCANVYSLGLMFPSPGAVAAPVDTWY